MENEDYQNTDGKSDETSYKKYSEKSEFVDLDELMMHNHPSDLEIEATLSDDID
jgi:hypothetical protein